MKINETGPDKLEFSYKLPDGSQTIILVKNEVLSEKPLKMESIEKQIQWNLSAPFQDSKPTPPSYLQRLESVYSFLDVSKNTLESLKVYSNIHQKAWWLHSTCNHSYLLSIPNRFKYEPPCSLCSYLKKPEYSFLITYWNESKNGKLNHIPSVNEKLYWLCPNCNTEEYKTINRLKLKVKCDNCDKIRRLRQKEEKVKERELAKKNKFHGSSLKERELLYFFQLIFGDQVKSRYKFNKIEIDVFVPEFNIAIEYDGYYYHKGKEYADKLKNDKLNAFGVNVIRIREKGLDQMSSNDIVCHIGKTDWNSIMNELLVNIKKLYPLSPEYLVLINQFLDQNINDIQIPVELLNPVLIEDSLSFNYPLINKDFHPDFNSEFKLSQISKSSHIAHKAMWWKCHKCNFEWREPASNLIRRNYSCHRCELQKFKHE